MIKLPYQLWSLPLKALFKDLLFLDAYILRLQQFFCFMCLFLQSNVNLFIHFHPKKKKKFKEKNNYCEVQVPFIKEISQALEFVAWGLEGVFVTVEQKMLFFKIFFCLEVYSNNFFYFLNFIFNISTLKWFKKKINLKKKEVNLAKLRLNKRPNTSMNSGPLLCYRRIN
jgi:hypothetical protein